MISYFCDVGKQTLNVLQSALLKEKLAIFCSIEEVVLLTLQSKIIKTVQNQAGKENCFCKIFVTFEDRIFDDGSKRHINIFEFEFYQAMHHMVTSKSFQF